MSAPVVLSGAARREEDANVQWFQRGSGKPGAWLSALAVTAVLFLPLTAYGQMGGCGGGGGGAGARPVQPRIQATYDRAGDMTIVTLTPHGDVQNFAIGAMYECSGSAACRPGVVQMMLVATAPRAAYENVDAVIFTVPDGDPLSFTPRYSLRRERAGVRESFSWVVSEDEFRALAGAQRVDVQLGAVRSQLTPDQRQALAALVGRMAAVQP